MEKFGRFEACAARRIPVSALFHYFLPLIVKYLGYVFGRFSGFLKRKDFFIPFLMLAAFIVGIFFCVLNIIPANDTCNRYAPMAEAFAAGNWKFAFHPMYGVFFSVVSGVICWIFSINGFLACQLAALLLWNLSILPLYALFKCCFDVRTAKWGCILYVFCSHLHRYMYDGLRDNGRTFGLALLCLGMVRLWKEFKMKQWKFSSFLILVSGGAVLTTLRADGFLMACIGLGFAVILDIAGNKFRFWRSVAATFLFLLFISPQIYLNWKTTKILSVSTRHSELVRKLIKGDL